MTTKELSASDWIRLRAVVLLLGEKNSWWPAKVLTGHGEQFLSFVFPKTKAQAAFQLITEISRMEHDQAIGSGRYHVFRLPQKWEEQIFLELKNGGGNFKVIPENELLSELYEMSSGLTISPAKGPLLVGNHDELHDKIVFQSIARHYYDAFKNNYRSYPYLN